MRRRGAGKCDFAHGGLELRVRANKRDRWGRHVGADGGGANFDTSGGEDTLGAARSIGRIRTENGERDGAGSAVIAGGRGGGGSAGAGAGGTRQGKRTKGGGVQGGDGGAGGGRPRGGAAASTGDPKSPTLGVAGVPRQRGGIASSRSPRRQIAGGEGDVANGDAGPGVEQRAGIAEDATAQPEARLGAVRVRSESPAVTGGARESRASEVEARLADPGAANAGIHADEVGSAPRPSRGRAVKSPGRPFPDVGTPEKRVAGGNAASDLP